AHFDIGCADVVRLAQAEALDRAMLDSEQWFEIRIVAIGQQQAITRNEVDKTLERGVNGGEVFENAGVIELNIVDDRNLGQVMHKLAPLVEKGGVVLVALDDKPIAVRETRALPKVVRNAANQITRIAG